MTLTEPWQYTSDIEKRVAPNKKGVKRSKTAAGIILDYPQQYYPFLFGHPLKLDEAGCVVAVVERTNNVAEHFFGKEKQQLRRRVGRGQLGRDLDDQPAKVALVANLKDPEYVHHLVGCLEKLPDAFADLDNAKMTERLALNRESRNTQLFRIVREMLEASAPYHDMEQSPVAVVLPMPQVKDPIVAEQQIADLLNQEFRAQKIMALPKPRDPRLPPTGTNLVRWYKGRAYNIEILENSFKYRGKTYLVLSDIVQTIVKSQRDCYVFLGLTVPWPQNEMKIRGRRLNRSIMIDLQATTEF